MCDAVDLPRKLSIGRALQCLPRNLRQRILGTIGCVPIQQILTYFTMRRPTHQLFRELSEAQQTVLDNSLAHLISEGYGAVQMHDLNLRERHFMHCRYGLSSFSCMDSTDFPNSTQLLET